MSPWYGAKINGLDVGDEIDIWKTNSMHFYRKPETFSKNCDSDTFDGSKLKFKNCTDTCIWLSMDNVMLGTQISSYFS